ncbi:MAG: TetR/AcrR family transcriptional regulator [bacterium]|nr:TetR/AcrR family transcriptional regulator [bacterium]
MAQQSNLARHRAEREGRSSNRRSEIIDAAEALFLERGIAATTMTDIAERVGVSRITLYRYFADCDALAFEVAGWMLERLVTKAREVLPAGAGPVEAARAGLGSLITNFEHNRDVHWYLTVLDSHRPFRDISEELAQWYASRTRQALLFDEAVASYVFDDATAERLVSLANVVMGVLGRFAIKGENLSRGGITLETQLGYFRELVFNYFDTIVAPQAEAPERHSDC